MGSSYWIYDATYRLLGILETWPVIYVETLFSYQEYEEESLTIAVEFILIQIVSCRTAAVEATNGVNTVEFTPSIAGGTLISICMR